MLYVYNLIFLSVTLHFSFGENFLRLALCGAVPSIYLCTLLLFLASIIRNQEGLSVIAIVFWVALCFLITVLPFHQLLQFCSTTVYVGLAILGLILYSVCSHTIRVRVGYMCPVFDEAKKHMTFREVWVGYLLGMLFLIFAIYQDSLTNANMIENHANTTILVRGTTKYTNLWWDINSISPGSRLIAAYLL